MNQSRGIRYDSLKILFKVQGSPLIGMGHVTRSLELARELSCSAPAKLYFWVNNDAVSCAKIRSRGFEVINNEECPDEMARFVFQNNINVIVFDQTMEFQEMSKKVRSLQTNVRMIALDYFNYDNQDLNVIINLYNHNIHQRRPHSDLTHYYEGVEYGIIRSCFDRYIHQEKPIPQRVQNVLITFGGCDLKKNTLKVIQAIEEQSPDDIHFHFVIGANFTHADTIQQNISRLRAPITVYHDIDNIEELMYSCDLAICGAGTTILELAALGTPALIIAQNAEEEKFGKMFAEHGAAELLGLADDVEANIIWKSLHRLLDNKRLRENMSHCGKQMVDGRGRQRIASMILI